MKRNPIRFTKHYRSFLITYLICTIIPLVVFTFGYVYSYKAIREDTNLYHATILNQKKYNYDKTFNQIMHSLSTVSRNDIISELMKKDVWTPEELFAVVDLNEELKKTADDISASVVGVYFKNNQSIVTNKNRYSHSVLSTFLDVYPIKLDLSKMERYQVKGYYLLEKNNGCDMVFYQKIYNEKYTTMEAYSFIILPYEQLMSISTIGNLSDESNVALINSENKMISNTNKVSGQTMNYDWFKADYDVESIELDHEGYVVSSIKSDAFDIRFCIYTPKSVFYRKVNYIKVAIFIELLLSITAGLFLSYYFTEKNYGPLEKKIHNLFDTQLNLEKQVTMQDGRIAENVLTGVLKGRNLTESWSGDYEVSLRDNLDLTGYRVILFAFDNLENHAFSYGKDESLNTYALLLFAVKNVINEVLLSKGSISDKSVTMEMDDMIVCIVPSIEDAELEWLTKQIHTCLDFFNKSFQLLSYAAVSAKHDGWNELSNAYVEALTTVTHKGFWGSDIDDVIYYDKEWTMDSEKVNENMLLEQGIRLSNCLVARNYKKASVLLDEMLETCFSKDISKMTANRSQAVLIVGLILNNLENVTAEYEDERKEISFILEDFDYSKELFKVKSLQSLKKELHHILDKIASKYEDHIRLEEPEWLWQVKEYVSEHYRDPEINVSTIAYKFGITLSYLGKVYRKYTGVSLLDQIHKLRIASCKEMLAKGMTIKDCAAKVGYSDSKALIRAFKRYEGITPGQYRTAVSK